MARRTRRQIAYNGMPLREIVAKVGSAHKRYNSVVRRQGYRVVSVPIYKLECGHTVHREAHGKERLYCDKCPKMKAFRKEGMKVKGKFLGKYDKEVTSRPGKPG